MEMIMITIFNTDAERKDLPTGVARRACYGLSEA
jgi:hypothetical protein